MKTDIRLIWALIPLLLYGLLFLPEATFLPLVEEDGIVENATAFFLLLSAIGFFVLFGNADHFRDPILRGTYSNLASRYVFLLLGILLFFGFGEEISWGQRIFGFSTPEAMAARNVQGEFNLHNLAIFNGRALDGTQKGVLSRLFTMKQLFIYFFLLFLIVVPLANRSIEKAGRLLKRFLIPVPPLWLGLVFLGNYVLYGALKSIFSRFVAENVSHGITEIEELNFSIILLQLPITWLGWSKDKMSAA